jgi:sulfide:quinone oxidoreductase
MSRQVLVLGAGVGGLVVADRLRELLPDEDRIVVVDRAADRVLGLSLLWVMRGWRTPEQVRFTPSAIDRAGIDVVATEVDEILLGERRVTTRAGELEYDALVVSLGAELDFDLVPGMREAIASGGAGEYYTLDGAAALGEQLADLEGGRISVLVGRVPFRCPAAPYEGALLLADLFAERGLRDSVQIDVFTPEPHPMPVAGRAVGEALVSILQERRIGFHPQVSVERIEPETRELVLDTGGRSSFDLLVTIPPHVPPRPVALANLSELGWIPVHSRTLTGPADGVWALGDVALLKLANDLPLPKAAVFAIGQAEAVADGVARSLGQDAPEPWFTGEGHCWIEIGGGKAAKGVGSFLEPSGPVVELYGASAEHHAEKEEEEREWIRQWSNPRKATSGAR